MLRFALVRRLPLGSLRSCRFPSSGFCTDPSPAASPPESSPLFSPPPPTASQPHQQEQQQGTTAAASELPPPDASASASAEGAKAAEGLRRDGSASARGGSYQEEQARVLSAALGHVMKLGWSEKALIAGARDAGISPSIVGSFPRKEAAFVEFFMDECLDKINKIDSGELHLNNLILSKRLSKLLRIRLEMQIPYISKWAEALSIQAQPVNLPTSFKQRAMLVDEIWHAAGDQTSDIDWYIKRTVLGGIYSTSEVYMLTDNSPEFQDTWAFLDHRIKDAFDIQKTVQEAAYLAEAVGVGIGNSTQAFMKRFLGGFKM